MELIDLNSLSHALEQSVRLAEAATLNIDAIAEQIKGVAATGGVPLELAAQVAAAQATVSQAWSEIAAAVMLTAQ